MVRVMALIYASPDHYWRLRKKSNICVTRNFSEFHVRQVRCILRNSASLDLELFTKPSDQDFLRVHHYL